MRQTSTETSQRYIDCLNLFLKHRGRSVTRIEREMRLLGHHDFSRRILYARTEGSVRRPGWIERYAWRDILTAVQTGGNTTGRECVRITNAGRRIWNAESRAAAQGLHPDRTAHHKSSPPSQGGVAAVSADGVGTPGRLTSGRGWPAAQHSRPDRTALQSSPPSQGGVAAVSADGVGTPGRLFSGRGWTAARHSRPDHAARVSTPLGDTARSTAPHSPATRLPHFKAWLKRVSPNLRWDLPHLQYLYTHLKKISDGTCKRLMIFMPPRHGKSETVTVRYTAWRIAQDPAMNVILGSYNQRLANRFSRKIRRVLADDAAITLRESRNADESQESVPHVVAGGVFRSAPIESRNQTTNGHCPECRGHKKQAKHHTSQTCTHTQNARPFTYRPANSESEWETGQGGTFRAVGVGSGVTGFGASLIVVDDPVKSRAEAESETYRDKVWDWFNDDLYTRLEPNGAIILIQTRWHEDDLAGRLIKEMQDGGEQWEIVNLPALCEEPEAATGQNHLRKRVGSSTAVSNSPQTERLNATDRSQEAGFTPAPSSPPRLSVSAVQSPYDPIGRLPGEALWPSRFDESALEKLRRKLGSYSFSALYQQRPVPADGGLFKISWFKNIVAAPPPGLKWHRGYDLAVSTKTTACYTASAKCAFDKDGNLYIADVMHKRMEYPEQRRYIYEKVATERDTEHGVELALHGHAIIQDLRRAPQLRGRPFRGVKVDADKITRALGWESLAEEGKVILVRGPWNQEFLNEVREFPSGKFDDQIDAVSLAVSMCRQRKTRNFWSF